MAKVVQLARAEGYLCVDSVQLLGDKPPPDVCPETGLPQSLNAFVVCQDPKITVLPNFLSDAECDHLMVLAEGSWMPSMVGGADYAQGKESEDEFKDRLANTVSNTRTSWSCMLRYAQTSVVERVEHRVASICGLEPGQVERFNMVRYAPGETFTEHHDGKFRPKTVFIYLNDLPPDDDQGDTFFPVLGYGFKPRRGTAVMWSNAQPDGREDSRMLHAGRAPLKGVKYGVNCFTNDNSMRQLRPITAEYPLDKTAKVSASELQAENGGPQYAEDGTPKMSVFTVNLVPKLSVVPQFLQPDEVKHVLELAGDLKCSASGPFEQGTQLLKTIDFEQTPTVQAVEARMVVVAADHAMEQLSRLRIVHPGTVLGLCNRGCGKKSIYVCLSERDEVLFPRLGMRLELGAGDAIVIPNVDFETGYAVEDTRTARFHVPNPQGRVVGIDGYFHDNPIREQQRTAVRPFVTDDEVASANK